MPTVEWGPQVFEWLKIAAGEKDLPSEFARFIAAWEVIVAWQRANSNDTTDKTLLENLEKCMPTLRLSEDSKWTRRVEALMEFGPVTVMKLFQPTKERKEIQRQDDSGGIVQTLYTVRCNLLKAGKSPQDKDDLRRTLAASQVAESIACKLIEG